MSIREIARSEVMLIFNKFQIVFQTGVPISFTPELHNEFSLLHILTKTWKFQSLILAISLDMQWCTVVILSCIFLITNEVDYLSICLLVIWISSFMNYLVEFLALELILRGWVDIRYRRQKACQPHRTICANKWFVQSIGVNGQMVGNRLLNAKLKSEPMKWW